MVNYCDTKVLSRITQVLILVPQMQEIEVFFTTLALRSTVTMLFMAKEERCLEREEGIFNAVEMGVRFRSFSFNS